MNTNALQRTKMMLAEDHPLELGMYKRRPRIFRKLLRAFCVAAPSLLFPGCFSLVNWAPEAHKEVTVFKPESVYYSEAKESFAYETATTTESPRRLTAIWTRSSAAHGYVFVSARSLVDGEVLERILRDEADQNDAAHLFAQLRDTARYERFSSSPEKGWTVFPDLPEDYNLIWVFESGEGFTIYSQKMIRYPVIDKVIRAPFSLVADVVTLPVQIIYFPGTVAFISHAYRHPDKPFIP